MFSGTSGGPLGAVAHVAEDPRLAEWVDAMLRTPGLTSIRNRADAFRQHVLDSLAAVPVLADTEGPIVDVGSGGGAPGLPLAAAFGDREVALLEASGRKCDFLRRAAEPFPNVRVVQGRAEEQPVDAWGAAVAKALAEPPVALEWCLALVRPGGLALLYTAGDVDLTRASGVSQRLGGGPVRAVPVAGGRALLVAQKLEATPDGFPRRPGAARKRPLA